MTQSPQSGQAAPMSTTGIPSASTAPSGTAASANVGSTDGSPAPSQAVGPQWPGGPQWSGSPQWTSTPINPEDAPTTSVPLVSTAAAPASTGSSGKSSVPDQNRPARARGPRRARLQLRHINPWTVLKFSCVLSIALFFVWLIVVGVLFGVLDGAGVIHKINDAYTTIQGGNAKPPVTAGVVFGAAAIIGVVNIVLFIALTTIGSVVYNLCADLVGGIEITLSER
jgi:Transmembrane domain of unknown function (DUF3566)